MDKIQLTSEQYQSLVKKHGQINYGHITDLLKLPKEKKKIKVIQPNKHLSELKLLLRLAGIEYVEEYKFCADRKFRFDMVICPVEKHVAVEFEGMVKGGKGGHQTIEGYSKNTDKYNLAASLGWTVLRYTFKNFHNVVDDLKKIM